MQYADVKRALEHEYRCFVQQGLADSAATQHAVAQFADISAATVSRVMQAGSPSLCKEHMEPIMATLGVPPYLEAAIRAVRYVVNSAQFGRVLGEAAGAESRLSSAGIPELVAELIAVTKGVVSQGRICRLLLDILAQLPDGWMRDADDADNDVDGVVVRVVFASGVLLGQWGEDRLALDAFQAVHSWPSLASDDDLVLRSGVNVIASRCFLSDPFGAYRMALGVLGWQEQIILPDDATRTYVFGALQACVAIGHLLESGRYVERKTLKQALAVVRKVAEKSQVVDSQPVFNWIVEARGTAAVIAAYLNNDDSWLDDLNEAQRALNSLRDVDFVQYRTWSLWHQLDRVRASFHATEGERQEIEDLRGSVKEIIGKLDPNFHKDIYRRCAQILRWLGAMNRRSLVETAAAAMSWLLPILLSAGYAAATTVLVLASHNTG